MLIAALGSMVQLAISSRRANAVAAASSMGVLLAVDKMEELRAQPWPAASPVDSLDHDAGGFADRFGGYARRWSVQPLPSNPADAVVLQVRVVSGLGPDVRLVTVRSRRAG